MAKQVNNELQCRGKRCALINTCIHYKEVTTSDNVIDYCDEETRDGYQAW